MPKRRNEIVRREINLAVKVEKAIGELHSIQKLLPSEKLDPLVVAAFRDTLNRTRNTAWAVQQYSLRQGVGEATEGILSFLVGERVRTTYLLCEVLIADLKRADVDLQPGSLIQLHGAMKALIRELNEAIKSLG